MSRAFSLAVALAVFWIFLSGHWEPYLLALGVASITVCVAVSRRMTLTDHEGHPIHIALKGLGYFPWLVKEIIVSNVYVARRILSGNVEPMVIDVRASQSDELGEVIYANSITLTPGTISIGVREGEITVHALTRDTADGLLGDEMNARVCAFVGDPAPPPLPKAQETA